MGGNGNGNGNGNGVDEEEDDMKGDLMAEIEPLELDLNAQNVSLSSMKHNRKRSNSFHSPSTPSYGRASVKYIGAYSAAMSVASSPKSIGSPPSMLSTVDEPTVNGDGN